MSQLMDDASVPFVVVFGIRRNGASAGEARRTGKGCGRAGGDALKARHLHVAGEAGVKGGIEAREIDRLIVGST